VDRRQALVERVATTNTVAMLVGGMVSGKTTLGRLLAATALRAGRPVGYLDADLGQKAFGPPTAVTMKVFKPEDADLLSGRDELGAPDAMFFVGATSPQGQLLPLVVGAARMQAQAFDAAAELVIVDTSGVVSGIYGQILKFHKVELLQPDVLIGLQRGEELDPLLGVIQRFFATEVLSLPVDPEVRPVSVEERSARRESAFREYFSEPLHRWRVKPTVFMPALPALFEQDQLDRILVGLSDGEGNSIGLGYLECSQDDGVLRLVSPVAEAPKALKLGSVRLDEGFRIRRVDLRNLFGTD
jgi:polynucleotide 5'-hydroxyl-kinase GRC3/NOL9